VLQLDPANERAHQHMMFCYVVTGERLRALEQYERCKRVLRAELGAEASPETEALYQWIKQAPHSRPALSDLSFGTSAEVQRA
jgi:DNA-binding SARP family transcriptional activator